jgi:hypothetical protein
MKGLYDTQFLKIFKSPTRGKNGIGKRLSSLSAAAVSGLPSLPLGCSRPGCGAAGHLAWQFRLRRRDARLPRRHDVCAPIRLQLRETDAILLSSPGRYFR